MRERSNNAWISGRIEEIPFSPKRISVGDDLVGDLLVKAGPKLWDLDTGEVLRTLEGHQSPITAVALLADGHRALSASGDSSPQVSKQIVMSCSWPPPSSTKARSTAILMNCR